MLIDTLPYTDMTISPPYGPLCLHFGLIELGLETRAPASAFSGAFQADLASDPSICQSFNRCSFHCLKALSIGLRNRVESMVKLLLHRYDLKNLASSL